MSYELSAVQYNGENLETRAGFDPIAQGLVGFLFDTSIKDEIINAHSKQIREEEALLLCTLSYPEDQGQVHILIKYIAPKF